MLLPSKANKRGRACLVACLTYIWPLTTRPFRDGAPFLLIIETSLSFGRLLGFLHMRHRNVLLILPPCSFAFCCHHLSPKIAIVFTLSIPDDFGNSGESTRTKLPMRNKQWQKNRKRDQTTANRMAVVFILRSRNRGMATGIYGFVSGICFRNKAVKFWWPYRGSYLVKQNKHTHTRSFDSP